MGIPDEHASVSKLVIFSPKNRHFRHLHLCPSCDRAVEEDNLLCDQRGDHVYLCIACMETARNRFGIVEVEGHLDDTEGKRVRQNWHRTGLPGWELESERVPVGDGVRRV